MRGCPAIVRPSTLILAIGVGRMGPAQRDPCRHFPAVEASGQHHA